MSCPFLREGRARYCHAADVRKLILDGPGSAGGGRCASEEYALCPLVDISEEKGSRCPHLEEIHVQYCGSAPVTKLVPFSDCQLSRCAGDSYRYCDSYVMVARPHSRMSPPPTLLYSPNHMWLEVSENGSCHVGIDDFLAAFAGKVDGVTFVTPGGAHRPAVAVALNGVEWPLVFPNPMLITGVNRRLRADASTLTSDPYGSGWLMEGWELPGRTRVGLASGPQAHAWMEAERERLNREIHETQAPNGDGGCAVAGIAGLLSRQEIIRLFQIFFANPNWGMEV